MKAKSDDLRERIVHLVTVDGLSRREAAERMMVGASTAIRVVKRFLETGSFAPLPCGGSVSPLSQHEDALCAMVDENDDATLDELRQMVFERLDISVSISAIDRALTRFDLRFKKKASSHQSRPGLTSPCAAATSAGSSNATCPTTSSCSSTKPA